MSGGGMPGLFDTEATSGAEFSPCRTYRYALTRRWAEGGAVCWVMLNPSTADESADDPTIRRCIGFTRAWGYGGLVVVNLFALRATDPRELYEHPDPVGPGNDDAIRRQVGACDLVVAAWGKHGEHRGRAAEVTRLLPRARCLRKNADGSPGHPLYLPANAKLLDFGIA